MIFCEFTKNDCSQKKREKRDRLLIELGLAKRELWSAWHLSKEDKEVQTKEKMTSDGGEGVSQERTKASIRSEGIGKRNLSPGPPPNQVRSTRRPSQPRFCAVLATSRFPER